MGGLTLAYIGAKNVIGMQAVSIRSTLCSIVSTTSFANQDVNMIKTVHKKHTKH